MILKKPYIVLSLFFLISFSQNLWASIPFQTPQEFRHFDEDFKERYNSSRYDYEGGNKVTRASSGGSGEYKDYEEKHSKTPEIEEEHNDDFFSIGGGINWIFYVALALAVVYLVYVLLNEGSTGLFQSNRNKKLDSIEDITSENIENADIKTLIKAAEEEGNFRLAIRYYYLLVLKTLTLKNHIKFEDDKTNAEYLNELEGQPFSKAFQYVSYLYSYIWYGKFMISNNQYQKAKNNFATLLKQVE
ncbi:hypothetical protein [Seonamhaeicola marinus]|uniref:DUF4129 domain-containing protein n=1 Tax=Seonamhaeicola marinus TaxID=1912246 RepID=A0A5D0ILA7_9FLAO|nr:hypothetical protein [Seonamhaeicola marinus]TYA84276.1 hypothetical protein FUA24_06405 [Seonamhaeicola marinus]